MIQIKSILIEEMRGLRSLPLAMDCKNFVISGPNGSGKSGVVDAIEFAFTGKMSRLAGKGTAGISVSAHGPHVDKRDYPDAASVTVEVHIPSLDRTVKVTRNINKPRTLVVEPENSETRAVLEGLALHPEVALSRREIIKFILSEASKRSEDVQTLLKLEDVGQIRKALKSASNALRNTASSTSTNVASAKNALARHIDVDKFSAKELLIAVRGKRSTLSLPEISKLESDTKLDDGVSEKPRSQPAFNKESALRDVTALADALSSIEDLSKDAIAAIREDLEALEKDPSVKSLKENRTKILNEYGGEAWVVNKAIHYNEWADFTEDDFLPVVNALRDLLSLWKCDSCNTWLYLSPRINPDTLRCNCSEISLNLRTE